MLVYVAWKLLKNPATDPPEEQLITSTIYSSTISNTPLEQTINSITTSIQNITFHTYSSIINTTEKSNIISRNKGFLSLFISLILISLCIGLSYCIFVYFNDYLNIKSSIQHDILILNRASFTSSESSDSNTELYTCQIINNILPAILDKKNEERRSSTDSIELFRY